MPTFEVESGGKLYEVEAPDMEAASKAIRQVVDPYVASILPLSKDQHGNKRFDPEAGVLGSLLNVLRAPHQVMSGELDPMSPEGRDRAMESAVLMSPMGVRTRAKGLGLSKERTPPPTADELLEEGARAISGAKKSDVVYTSKSVADLATGLKVQLARDFHPTVAPKTHQILDSIIRDAATPGAFAEMGGVIAARDNFRRIARTSSADAPGDQAMASQVIQALDAFIARPPEGSVVAGAAREVGERYAAGRANYAAGKRSQGINARTDNADLQAAVAASGRGSGNKIRAAAKWYADPLHKDRLHGFSAEEAKLIRQVAKGTTTRNTLRAVGNLLGGGGGLGTVVAAGTGGAGIGAMAGNPALGGVAAAAVPTVGFVARALDNRLTSAAMREADEAVRKRSPLFADREANALATLLTPFQRAAIVSGAGRPAAVNALPKAPRTLSEYEEWAAAGNI